MFGLLRDNYDPDADAYIANVESSDGQPLESEVRRAITRFVKGCKQDAIWDAIKSSCILAGARTLTGALTPLVGNAPTNNNFTSGDYSRKTGLKGNGTNKYLDSNRQDNLSPTNSNSLAVYVTEALTAGALYIGIRNGSYFSSIVNNGGSYNVNLNSSGGATGGFQPAGVNGVFTGFAGVSRSSSDTLDTRVNNTDYTVTDSDYTALTRTSLDTFVFARNNAGSANNHSNPRMSFYSIGEAIDLAKLDYRVTTLMAAFDTFIP